MNIHMYTVEFPNMVYKFKNVEVVSLSQHNLSDFILCTLLYTTTTTTVFCGQHFLEP